MEDLHGHDFGLATKPRREVREQAGPYDCRRPQTVSLSGVLGLLERRSTLDLFRGCHSAYRTPGELARTASFGASASASDWRRASLDELIADTVAPRREPGVQRAARIIRSRAELTRSPAPAREY